MPKSKPELLVQRRGRLLAELRVALTRTQETMARVLGVHPVTVAAWESTLRPMPSHRLDQLWVLVERSQLPKKDRAAWQRRIEAVR